MKALSFTQPWGTLVVIGAKRVETRSWSTDYAGLIAIHASKKFPGDAKDTACRSRLFSDPLVEAGYRSVHDLPTGAIIGTARIMGCRLTQDVAPQLDFPELAFGDYMPGRFAWFLSDAVRFASPIPCKGALGLWRVPTEIAAAVADASGTLPEVSRQTEKNWDEGET